MEILKLENLVKTYGKGETKINAVDDISFTIIKENLLPLLVQVVVESLPCCI